MILSHIAAMAKNRVIGKDNRLPWNIPEDLQFFKKKTSGRIMIMGRKTFESLPGHLPNRYHIVISRNSYVAADEPDVSFVTSVEDALVMAKKLTGKYGEEVFVVGGAEIYKQTLSVVDRIYLTIIEQNFEGDTQYPEFSESEFLLVEQNDRPGPPPFSFRTYLRKQ